MSDVRSQILDLRSQMSDLRCQISDLRSQMSDLRCQISDLRSQMSDLRTQMSDVSGIMFILLPQVSLGVVVEVMRFIIRLNLQKPMQQEIALLVEQFDTAMCATYATLRRTNMDAQGWWNIYGKEASLVLDSVAVQQVLSAEGSWSDMAPQVANLCALSALGRKLFGWAQPFIISEKVAIMIDKAISEVGEKITQAMGT